MIGNATQDKNRMICGNVRIENQLDILHVKIMSGILIYALASVLEIVKWVET